MKAKQVEPWNRWPSGDSRSIAIIDQSPAELEKALGIRFALERDDLDAYQFAALADPSAGQIWLLHYANAPARETEVLVDSALPPEAAIDAVRRALDGAGSLSAVLREGEWRDAAPKPLVLILHGPSGVGKESVIEQLQAATSIHRAMSTTDRPPRPGERDGVDYHFVTTEEFERRLAENRFAESAHVYDDWKGLERAEIEGPLARGEDVIIRTDVQGARTWRARLEGAVSIVIIAADPAESSETHRARTRDRIVGREPTIPPDVLERRLREVDEELADIPNNDYVVTNHEGDLGSAVDQIRAIVERERYNPDRPYPRIRAEMPSG